MFQRVFVRHGTLCGRWRQQTDGLPIWCLPVRAFHSSDSFPNIRHECQDGGSARIRWLEPACRCDYGIEFCTQDYLLRAIFVPTNDRNLVHIALLRAPPHVSSLSCSAVGFNRAHDNLSVQSVEQTLMEFAPEFRRYILMRVHADDDFRSLEFFKSMFDAVGDVGSDAHLRLIITSAELAYWVIRSSNCFPCCWLYRILTSSYTTFSPTIPRFNFVFRISIAKFTSRLAYSDILQDQNLSSSVSLFSCGNSLSRRMIRLAELSVTRVEMTHVNKIMMMTPLSISSLTR